jgi:hypothetical protein
MAQKVAPGERELAKTQVKHRANAGARNGLAP